MKIIINDILEFNSDTGVLTKTGTADDPVGVVLTRTAARLLLILLTHHDKILSRDFLMQNVWVKYNLKPSNASLNNNVTLLRKSLSELDANPSMIITHPKMGIELQCTTSTLEEAEVNDSLLTAPDTRLRTVAIAICYCIVLMTIFALLIKYQSNDASHYKFIGKVENCSVLLIRASRGLNIGQVKKSIEKSKVNCKDAQKDLYVDIDGVGRARAENTFLFVCQKEGKDKYTSCDNFISYTEKTAP